MHENGGRVFQLVVLLVNRIVLNGISSIPTGTLPDSLPFSTQSQRLQILSPVFVYYEQTM